MYRFMFGVKSNSPFQYLPKYEYSRGSYMLDLFNVNTDDDNTSVWLVAAAFIKIGDFSFV